VRFTTTTNQKLPEQTVISKEITYIKLRIEDDLHTQMKNLQIRRRPKAPRNCSSKCDVHNLDSFSLDYSLQEEAPSFTNQNC
jgi:hypothetical protein